MQLPLLLFPTLSAKFTRNGSITVSGGPSKDGKRVFLAVADTGLGIPKDKFGQIFGAFEQVDMSTTRSYGGTGLGLHLVKQLVEAHSGETSVLNIGSGHFCHFLRLGHFPSATLNISMLHFLPMRMSAGEITVESELGSGSTFTVWLPITRDSDLPPLDPNSNDNRWGFKGSNPWCEQ